MIYTQVIIVTMSTLYFVFEAPYLAEHASIAIPLLYVYCMVQTLVFLFRASWTDPGILPRSNANESFNLHGSAALVNTSIEISVRGEPDKVKFCFTCNMYRSPRTSHCSTCDNCVANWDHHCPWVGNCVGLRNYRFFYLFVLFAAIDVCFIFGAAIFHIVHMTMNGTQFSSTIAATPVSLILCLMNFFLFWMLGGLACYHSCLLISNMTTNEHIKLSPHQNMTDSPFSRGSLVNCWGRLMTSTIPYVFHRK